MPFRIQRIQTDRGPKFFAMKVQRYMAKQSIKFRPIKPASPHLNGKVERTQRTDLEEFYATADLRSSDFKQLIEEWQFFYNWPHPHGALHGKSPIDKVCELMQKHTSGMMYMITISRQWKQSKTETIGLKSS